MNVHAEDTTRDTLMREKVTLHQQASGTHRAGLDTVLLAASISHNDLAQGHRVTDLGAGAGGAGMCVAMSHACSRVRLVENDPQALAMAMHALDDKANIDFSKRLVLIAADITASGPQREEAGLTPNSADHVIMNPPYYHAGSTRPSPNEKRKMAHVLGDKGLLPWVKTAASILTKSGTLTVIFPASGLASLMAACERRFGGLSIVPIHPREGLPASRILLRATKGSRAPLTLLPPLILHPSTGNRLLKRAKSLCDGEETLTFASPIPTKSV